MEINLLNNGTDDLFLVSGETTTGVLDSINYLKEGNVTEILYDDLVTLKDASGLTPGRCYRITDYVTYYYGNDAKSALHPFDIIVIADDDHTLNECARAALHDGDTYFSGCNLSAWQVWYKLDDNIPVGGVIMSNEITSKWYKRNPDGDIEGATYPYSWIYGSGTSAIIVYTASETPTIGDSAYTATEVEGVTTYEVAFTIEEFYLSGKGTIYRLIDEYENDVDYDFKNVLWKRFVGKGRSYVVLKAGLYNALDIDFFMARSYYLGVTNTSSYGLFCLLFNSDKIKKGSSIPEGEYVNGNNVAIENVDRDSNYYQLYYMSYMAVHDDAFWFYTFTDFSIASGGLPFNIRQVFNNKNNILKNSRYNIIYKGSFNILDNSHLNILGNNINYNVFKSTSNCIVRAAFNYNRLKAVSYLYHLINSQFNDNDIYESTYLIRSSSSLGACNNNVIKRLNYSYINSSNFVSNQILDGFDNSSSRNISSQIVWFTGYVGDTIINGAVKNTSISACQHTIFNGYVQDCNIKRSNRSYINGLLNSTITVYGSMLNYIYNVTIESASYCNITNITNSTCTFIVGCDIKNCNYLTLTSSQTTSTSSPLKNLEIKGIVGTSENPKVISHDTVNDPFITTYQPTDSRIINI